MKLLNRIRAKVAYNVMAKKIGPTWDSFQGYQESYIKCSHREKRYDRKQI